MKFTIGYTIYNKEFLIEKIINGVAAIDGVDCIFFFDSCTDGSLKEFKKHFAKLKYCRAFVNNSIDIFEILSNNFILSKFTSDFCILVQDDLILYNQDFIELAGKIYMDDPNAGLIGFKDGYEMSVVNQYENMISSPWSNSKYSNLCLCEGEYQIRTFVNRGPLCVPRKLIDAIGLFDEAYFPLFYDDNDLSLRSKRAKFNNYIAFSEIETKKSWGATRTNSKLPLQDIYLSNQIRFAKKWNLAMQKKSMLKSIKGNIRSRLMKVKHRIFANNWQNRVMEIRI